MGVLNKVKAVNFTLPNQCPSSNHIAGFSLRSHQKLV